MAKKKPDYNYNRVSITLTAEFDLRTDHRLVKVFSFLTPDEQREVLAGTVVQTMERMDFLTRANRGGSFAFLRSIK